MSRVAGTWHCRLFFPNTTVDGVGRRGAANRRTPMRMFGNGDMILHVDAKTDEASMVSYADNFYALEDAVNREMTRLKSASEFAAGLAVFVVDVVYCCC